MIFLQYSTWMQFPSNSTEAKKSSSNFYLCRAISPCVNWEKYILWHLSVSIPSGIGVCQTKRVRGT